MLFGIYKENRKYRINCMLAVLFLTWLYCSARFTYFNFMLAMLSPILVIAIIKGFKVFFQSNGQSLWGRITYMYKSDKHLYHCFAGLLAIILIYYRIDAHHYYTNSLVIPKGLDATESSQLELAATLADMKWAMFKSMSIWLMWSIVAVSLVMMTHQLYSNNNYEKKSLKLLSESEFKIYHPQIKANNKKPFKLFSENRFKIYHIK